MFNFRLFVVNQRAGVVFCFDLFFRQRGRFCLWRHESLGRDGHWLADFGQGKILQLLNQLTLPGANRLMTVEPSLKRPIS